MTINSEMIQASTTISQIKQEVSNKATFDTSNPLIDTVPVILSLDNFGVHNSLQEIISGTIVKLEDDTVIYLRPNCFRGCKELQSAKFSKLTKICRLAFCSCYKFNTLVLASPQIVQLDSIDAFRYTQFELGTGKIYVTDSLVQDYKQAPNWNHYSNIIVGISSLT